jgi:hypothetical protein
VLPAYAAPFFDGVCATFLIKQFFNIKYTNYRSVRKHFNR